VSLTPEELEKRKEQMDVKCMHCGHSYGVHNATNTNCMNDVVMGGPLCRCTGFKPGPTELAPANRMPGLNDCAECEDKWADHRYGRDANESLMKPHHVFKSAVLS